MSFAMPLPDRISQTHQSRTKQRLLTAQFGDGYFQSAPDGINSLYEEWDIGWDYLSQTDRNTVVTVLKGGATDYITWTTPNDGVTKKFQIVPVKPATLFTEQIVGGQWFVITVSLIQVA